MQLLPPVLLVLALLSGGESARVLGLFHFHGRSHWVMFQSLLRELARRGHDVTVVSHFPQKDPPPGYRDLSLKGTLPNIVNSFSVDYVRNISMLKFIWVDMFQFCKPNFEHSVTKELIKNKGTYDVIISEVFGPDCFAAFQHHLGGVPVVSMTSSVMLPWGNPRVGNPDNPSYIPNYFVPFSDHMSFWERLVNTVVTLFTSNGFDYLCTGPMDDINRQHFGDDIPKTVDIIRNISLLLVNSHFSLNIPRPLVPSVVEVGGIHVPSAVKPLPSDLRNFMDTAPSDTGVVLFTFGSLVRIETLSKELLTAIVVAFQQLAPQRFVWKVDADALRAQGITVPKNIYASNWLPQFDILSHPNIRAFISHGGLMGTQEAIHCAVPVLGIPLFADQKLNVPNLVRQGVAIQLELEDITTEQLVDSLRKLTEPGSKYRARASELSMLFRDRPRPPLEEAVYWVEYVARHGGAPHLRSAALDLAWYQYLLLDVIALVVVAVTTVLVAMWFVVKKLVYLLAPTKSIARLTRTPQSKSKKA